MECEHKNYIDLLMPKVLAIERVTVPGNCSACCFSLTKVLDRNIISRAAKNSPVFELHKEWSSFLMEMGIESGQLISPAAIELYVSVCCPRL